MLIESYIEALHILGREMFREKKISRRILLNVLCIATWKLPDATSNAPKEPLNKPLSSFLFQPRVQIVHRKHYKNNLEETLSKAILSK